MSKIFYIQSYDPEANIGRAYNEHIKHLPDDCCVCITDHDSNFLIPDFGKQLHDIIEKNGEEYALLGCITNRLGGKHQLYKNEFSNDFDMRNHFTIARELHTEKYAQVEDTTGVAGLCMLFRKSTWNAVGGFMEGVITADTVFNKAIKAKGLGKIGLMKGVYLYHNYRIWQSDHKKAWMDTKHLRKV